MSTGKRRKPCGTVTVVPLLRAGRCGSVSSRQTGRKFSAVHEGCWTLFPQYFSRLQNEERKTASQIGLWGIL